MAAEAGWIPARAVLGRNDGDWVNTAETENRCIASMENHSLRDEGVMTRQLSQSIRFGPPRELPIPASP